MSRSVWYILVAVICAGITSLICVTFIRSSSKIAPTPGSIGASEKAGPPAAYPDPYRIPGALNPDVTQKNIFQTICNPSWMKTIRPPETYTARLKRLQMSDWALPGPASNYEEDHFVSLELGGNPSDPRNLWPEPYSPRPGAREKDVVETYLHRQVCRGGLTLDQAQRAITSDWFKVYLAIHD